MKPDNWRVGLHSDMLLQGWSLIYRSNRQDHPRDTAGDKWTDDQGNVIYSDTPHRGAIEMDVPTKPASGL